MFYDANNVQLSTTVDDVTSEDTAKKYVAWGWNVIIIDGNDADEIREGLRFANKSEDKPTLIIGKTIMGKGCLKDSGENFEGETATHGQPISAAGASYKATILNLGGDPENAFKIFPEVKKLFLHRKEELIKQTTEKKKSAKKWAIENKELAIKLNYFLSGNIPDFDFSKIEQSPNAATRVASATVLSAFANEIENMLVSSADLSNSDKTDGFLKNTKPLSKNDFSGAFLQAGVCELTMACIMNGVALHGGVIPVCATFFVFSDYMKPAVRLSALMELPVVYIWTHDAFRVGEDGPTHQPIEHEAQIRLMEKLQNHSGKNAMLVLRPADVEETTVSWKMALENKNTPTALLLSRQNIKNLPVENPYQNALKATKGGYTVLDCEGTPDVILLASGSEVSTLIEASKMLNEKIKVRVVSVPSEGLFRCQEMEYQQAILPVGVPRFGLTAGLTINLEGLVGEKGKVLGLNHFGYSAPATVLDDKFGFTPAHISNEINNYLI